MSAKKKKVKMLEQIRKKIFGVVWQRVNNLLHKELAQKKKKKRTRSWHLTGKHEVHDCRSVHFARLCEPNGVHSRTSKQIPGKYVDLEKSSDIQREKGNLESRLSLSTGPERVELHF